MSVYRLGPPKSKNVQIRRRWPSAAILHHYSHTQHSHLSATEASQIMSSICDRHFKPQCRVPHKHLWPICSLQLTSGLAQMWSLHEQSL